MGQLRLQQADGVAPGAESARPILYASFPRYLGDFVLWNKIANLPQKVKPTTCWFDAFFVFHPCRVAGSKRQANTFFIFCGMAVMTFKEWVDTVPCVIRDDPVWRVEAYRLALFAGDLA